MIYQCVRINNEKNGLQNKILGVPQSLFSSFVGSILFNLFFNNFLFFILIASFHNFADSLKQTLESEYNPAIKWFHENKMILSLDKFQAIVLDKLRSSNTQVIFLWFGS